MRVVSSDKELRSMVGPDGLVVEPVRLKDWTAYHSVYNIKRFDGVFFSEGCEVWGLSSVESLDGVHLMRNCWLDGLGSVSSLKGVRFAEGCTLDGLESVASLEGVRLKERCNLSGLSMVRSLQGLELDRWCELYGLESVDFLGDVEWWPVGVHLYGLRNAVVRSAPEWLRSWVFMD